MIYTKTNPETSPKTIDKSYCSTPFTSKDPVWLPSRANSNDFVSMSKEGSNIPTDNTNSSTDVSGILETELEVSHLGSPAPPVIDYEKGFFLF